MKTVLVAVSVCLLSALNAAAQWNDCTTAPAGSKCIPASVGIGTMSPIVTLDVNPSSGSAYIQAKGANAALLLNHTATNFQSAINFRENDADKFIIGTGVYNPDSTNFDIGTAAVSLFRIQANGNVGIGTTSPVSNLDVFKAAAPVVTVRDAASGLRLVAAGGTNFIQSGTDVTTTNSKADLQFTSINNATSWMTIKASGAVGISTTSPNAGSKLDVRGGLSINQIQTATQRGSRLDVGWSGSGYADIFFGDYTNGWAIGENDDESMRIFKTSGNVLSSTPLTIQAGGNVGIGTTGPNAALEVLGNQAIFRQTGGGANVQLGDLSGNSTGYVTFATSNNATNWRITSNNNIPGGLEFLPSTAAGGNAYPTTAALAITNTGRVGIGLPNPGVALDVAGSIHASGNISGGTVTATFQDVAEWVPSSGAIADGTVVIVSERAGNTVVPSSTAYDTRVAGVVSPAPGLLLGVESPSKSKIATTGRVKVRADASKGAIHLGDLLVTSDTPGTAMRSEPLDLGGVKIHRPGTLIGKALEPLAKGQGEILVLLSLQ